MRTGTVALVTLVLALMGPAALCQFGTSDSHPVTVIVLEREDIYIAGGDIEIILPPPTLASPVSAVNSTCDLYWWTNSNRPKDVTVQTDLASPRYQLTVEARNITPIMMDPKNGKPGAAMGVVTLAGTGAQFFIRQIQRCFGTCDLYYTATADFADGLGSESHTVTYTFIDR